MSGQKYEKHRIKMIGTLKMYNRCMLLTHISIPL